MRKRPERFLQHWGLLDRDTFNWFGEQGAYRWGQSKL